MNNKFPKCEECALRLKLKVHYLVEDKDAIENLLENKNANYICLAFANEGVGFIGDFEGIGCENFQPKRNDNENI